MSPGLKLVSGEEAVKKFKRAGWTAPQHDELGPGLLRKLITQAGLTIEEFNEL